MKPANLVIEIKDGNVVAVTSTNPEISYIVFSHDTRGQDISPYQPDLCLKSEDMSKHINDLLAARPEKPQEHIKSFLSFTDGSTESRFTLPDGETITVQLPAEAMTGKTMFEKYAIMMARIDKHRACSQANMDK